MLRRTAHIALDRPRLAAWTLLAATCAFAIGGAALMAGQTAVALGVDRDARGGSMVIYLGDGADEAAGYQLTAQLTAVPGVLRASLVPASESANRLAGALSADRALLEGIDLTSLPASIEVELERGARDVIAISPAVQALRDTQGVADVVVEPHGRDADGNAVRRLSALAGGAATVVAALALLIAFGAMRVWLERDRDAYRVFDLLGASPGFARGPTIFAGVLLGGASATCAALTLAVGVAWRGTAIAAQLAPLGAISIAFPPGVAVLGCVGLGATIGALAGWLAGDSRGAR